MVALINSRFLRIVPLLIAVWCCSLWAANVEMFDQELNVNGQGYTILRVWGSYYEMGYAHASVLGDYIVEAIDQTKVKLGGNYAATRNLIASSVWLPLESEKELDGMVDCLNTTHPAAAIDKLDLKVFNTLGDWLYACRSHTCWGRYVADPVKTLSTRRLDFSTALPILNHHVLIAYDPNDATAKWLNLSWPGIVTVAQGINEYGTLVSLHDYQSFPADLSEERMSRLVAARYAITYITSDDISTQLEHVFAELQNYEIMTGGFINYYAPLGFGGVINCSPKAVGPDFYRLRTPQATWHHGEAMVTTNRDTNGTYTPSDEDFGVDAYYNDETPKTHESHWHLVDPVTANHGLSRLSVAYRGRWDMTVWADGRLDGIGRTPRLEYKWSELFNTNVKYSGGTGEPNDPYKIATAEDLMLLGETPEDYDKHFILTADIDLDPNLPGRKVFDRAVIAPDTINSTNLFLGIPFTGVFNGSEHTISHLTISGHVDFLGLFGQLGSEAMISSVGLVDADVVGTRRSNIGLLVGQNIGNVSNSYGIGSVAGEGSVGGLVGINEGSVSYCYSTGMVSGEWSVGGLAGRNESDANITVSYSTSSVSGDRKVGGLTGSNYGSITMSYSTGAVTGEGWSVGGLVGDNEGRITMSYSTGMVNGNDYVGGLVGESWGYITVSYSTGTVIGNSNVGGLVGSSEGDSITSLSFWDMETSGQPTSASGTGLTTAEMQDLETYLNSGWDFVDEIHNGTCDYWQISKGEYPRLQYHTDNGPVMPEGLGTAEQPYLIRDDRDLGTVWFKPTAHYCLETSLDLSGTTWSMAVVPWFDGTFEGNGHVISNLRIEGIGFLGLFGQTGPQAKISNVGLEAVDVTGGGGGLVSGNWGTITSCYSTGSVTGGDGLVGSNWGTITSCHSTASVTGGGGLVGANYSNITMSYSTGSVTGGGGLVGGNLGIIMSCYSTSEVRGDGSTRGVGGLVGFNDDSSIISSYSTGSVSGDKNVGGLVGINSDATITMSYSTGSVSGDRNVGGLAGSSYGNITMSYSIGMVTGNDGVGGLVGYAPEGSINLSFWDMETSGLLSSDGGISKTTAEMQTASTFLDAGWDFVGETVNGPNDVWKMWDGYDYPRLIWELGPNTPLVFVDINDPGFYGQMSKYEVTNAQYCDFLNTALASGDITIDGNDVYGAVGSNSGEDYAIQRYYRCDGSGYTGYGATNGGAARIHYSEGTFSVNSGFGNHPVTYVSWYGAMAFANYYGYYLPTEEQWQAVADYDGTYIYGCGEIIDQGIANYRISEHPDGTTPVGSFGIYGYGISDMAGNVWEWTSSSLDSNRIFRGGGMGSIESDCDVSIRGDGIPHANYWDIGFRVCR